MDIKKIQKIQEILEDHSIEVSGLLRKHKIAGDLSIDTINKAYGIKGEQFMMELLQIITPTSNFTSLAGAESWVYDPLADPLSDETYNSYLNEGGASSAANSVISNSKNSSSITGSAGSIWNTLLGGVGSLLNPQATQTSIANATAAQLALQQNANSNSMIYLIAGIFVLFIIIFLFFKK